jgi:hypothetical protein
MEHFTVKELRKIAQKHNLAGRSKYTRKSDLYNFVVDILGEDFKGLSIEDSDIDITSDLETMNIEEEEEDFYDYVIVQSHSTSKLFPPTGPGPKYDVSSFVQKLSENHDKPYAKAVWAISGWKECPCRWQVGFNAPFDLEYTDKEGKFLDNRAYEYDISVLGKLYWTPRVPAEDLGYDDLLKKYAKIEFFSKMGRYSIPQEHVEEFLGEIAIRSRTWKYRPKFVKEVKKVLKENNLQYDQCVIFVDVPVNKLDQLERFVFELDYDDIKSFEKPIIIKANKDLHLAYIKAN